MLTQNIKITQVNNRVHSALRTLAQGLKISQTTGKVHNALRRLAVKGNINDTTSHGGTYIRLQQDLGNAIGEVKRSIGICIKIITTGLIRDYLINRFLKSNITREIILESRIH
jgi:hypothetical protein